MTQWCVSYIKRDVRLPNPQAKTGFTLVELIVSLAIATIVSLALTTMLNQSYASQKKLESLSHLYSRATLLFTQLERDLMGATIPIENILALEAKDAKKEKNSKQAEAQQAEKKEQSEQSESKSEKKESDEVSYKSIDKVFYYTRTNNQMFFSWITKNPLQLYWGSSVGVARPRIARVMYRLEPDPKDKTLFKLMRSEGFDLTYTPYEKHTDQKYKGYALVDDIKSIKITCVAVQEKKDEAQIPLAKAGEQKKSEKPPVTEVKMLDSWEWPRSEENKKSGEKVEQELPPLPQGVRIELVLWDAARERDVTFEYGILIPALPRLQRQKKEADKKPAAKEPQVLDVKGAASLGKSS